MRTEQEPHTSAPESRDRRNAAASADGVMGGDVDRRGMERSFADALADILRWEEAQSRRAARH